MRLDISELLPGFPDFRVAAVLFDGMTVGTDRPDALARAVAAAEGDCRERWSGTELSAVPGIAVWRRAYRAFGIKRTSYRCSVERLVKNVLAGRGLPAINPFVDAYNAVSLRHVLPLGADDADRISGDIAFRYARPGDSFTDMGEDGAENDPPKPGEVVYADGSVVLCRRWNWRQDARSLVTPATRRALVTVQWLGEGDLVAAADDLVALVGACCGGSARLAIADRDRPVVSLDRG